MSIAYNAVRPPHSYARSRPTLFHFQGEDNDFLEYARHIVDSNIVNCPSQGYFLLSNAYLFEGRHVIDDRGEHVEDSLVDVRDKELFIAEIRSLIATGHFTFRADTDRLCVAFAKAGAGNYGHFITDCLPKLLNLKRITAHPVTLFLPPEAEKFSSIVSAICLRLQIDAEIFVAKQSEVMKFSKIIYLSSVSVHNTQKSETVRELSWIVNGMYPSSHDNKRLYIGRRSTGIRHIVNSNEIEELFVSIGFEVIYPEDHSFSDQVKIFNRASAVAGPLGAGLANIIWAMPETPVFMIDPGLTDFYFWDLASLQKQRFYWYFAGNISRYSERLEASPFYVDVKDLSVCLASAVDIR